VVEAFDCDPKAGCCGQHANTLCSTNPCESMIEIVRCTQRNVKRWQEGDMRKRWTPASMLVAEQGFRRIIGYRNPAKFVIAIERHADRVELTTARTGTNTQVSDAATVSLSTPRGRPPPKFHDDPGILG
jgi:hypothetical protein